MRMMILDTSSQYLLVSFREDDKIIFESITVGKNNHSDNLLKTIKLGLDTLKLEVKDFDMIVCGIGPGAYTGLRVSLTVAKMFCWTLNKPLYTISSLDLLATKYFTSNAKKVVAINMHAKNGYVYHKIIRINNQKKETLEDDAFLSIEEAKAIDGKYKIDAYVNNDNIAYSALGVNKELITRIDDTRLLEPNYMREGI